MEGRRTERHQSETWEGAIRVVERRIDFGGSATLRRGHPWNWRTVHWEEAFRNDWIDR
jgi:hypothetical protein